MIAIMSSRIRLILTCGAIALAIPGAGVAQSAPTQARPAIPSADEIAKLPPDGGDEFNRLVFEKSPYLLQHARNPVDWHAWSDAAFELARTQQKPVFLSIGYSTCHWCHVMEHESFEDAEVAALLNERFVSIKVDREERPDVDDVYMSYCQAMTGSGGWPLTIVMTPDKKPFFAGTYLPKTERSGRRGLIETLTALADGWKDQRESIVAHADTLLERMRARTSSEAGDVPGAEVLKSAFAALSASFDAQNGGFGGAPKFPRASDLRFLLRMHARDGEARALSMVEATLTAIARGGIHDQLGGGFHRYATDRAWLVPHFEKMLYDQALLVRVYCETFTVTRRPEFEAVARTTIEYVLRELTSPEGAFLSAEDADSEGVEGLFYLWTPAELERALGAEDAAFARTTFGVTEAGNMHELIAGERRSVLQLAVPPADPESVRRLERVRARLFDVREARVRPFRDDKVLADWNGLMIGALAVAARTLDEPRYADAARRAADFVDAKFRDEKGNLLRRYRAGEVGLAAVLDDYAFLCEASIELYETDFDPRHLVRARRFADEMIARCGDEAGGFFLAPKAGEQLPLVTKSAYDGAVPSGNSIAAGALLRLARLTGETSYEERAQGVFRAFARDLAANPSAHTAMLCALDHAIGPAFEVVIAGARDAEDTRALLDVVRSRFRPNTVLVLRPDGDDAITKAAPWTADYRSIGGKAAAYVCTNFACQAPVTDPEELRRALYGV